MSHILARRRAPFILFLSLIAVLLVGSIAAIGVAATQDENTIELELFAGNTGEFRYDDISQTLDTTGRRCELSSSSINGEIMVLRGLSYDKKGAEVDPAPVGIVGQRLGVDKDGNGRNSSCGRIDALDRGNEILKMALGTAVDQLIERAVLDIEATAAETIEFTYLKGGVEVASSATTVNAAGQATARNGGDLFDELWISTPDGNISVLGGVFHLEFGQPDVAIEVLTNGSDPVDGNPNYIPVGSDVIWTYTLTNIGEGPATIVSVTDTPGDDPGYVGGDTNENSLLDTDETWLYRATGIAEETVDVPYANTGTVAVEETDSDPSNNSDSSGYFGVRLDLTIDKQTSGSANGSGTPYVGPADDVLIFAGDTVTWTYDVANNSNVPLTGLRVVDDIEGAATCTDTDLGVGDTTSCEIVTPGAEQSAGVAFTDGTYEGGYANEATAYGTPPVGVFGSGQETSSDPDPSSYFGMSSALLVSVTNDGIGDPPVVSAETVTWTIFVENLGNTEINLITATEDLFEGIPGGCELEASLLPGESDTCDIEVETIGGPQDRTFTVTGKDPTGADVTETSEIATYYGGLACGESFTEGGAGVDDTPLASFLVGPHKNGSTCAVPVIIETTNTTNTEGGEQTVNVAPPAGYPNSWDGVTGLVTIEWDVEVAVPEVLRATLQRVDESDPSLDIPIPACTGPTAVGVTLGTSGFYELDPVAIYPGATGGGDVCLVQHFFQTVTYDPDGTGPIDSEVRTRSVEVFYIWNDPKFVRR